MTTLQLAEYYSSQLGGSGKGFASGSGLDVHSLLAKLPGLPWGRYKGEKHLPGHNFTGAQTNLDKRLDADDAPKPDSKPVNRVDEAAMYHDIAYRDAPDLQAKHKADREMIERLDAIEKPTFKERVERFFVKKAMQAKLKLGGGTASPAGALLAEERHREFRRPKHLLKVKVFNKDDIWSADLINMPPERGYKYCLTVIDLYTRYAWVVPLKRKTATEVKEALEKIIKESGRKPKKLWTDKGREFNKKALKEEGMELYHTENEGKAVVVERFNRTLKRRLFKRFTAQGTQRWKEILPEIVEQYNNKVHSSIGVSPEKASKDPLLIRKRTMENNFENESAAAAPSATQKKPRFRPGDRVRIFKYKNKFEKGYVGYWTSEIFEVAEVLGTSPVTYRIKDLDDEEITGKFYEEELQKTEL